LLSQPWLLGNTNKGKIQSNDFKSNYNRVQYSSSDELNFIKKVIKDLREGHIRYDLQLVSFDPELIGEDQTGPTLPCHPSCLNQPTR
jgi:thymidylate synthase